MEFKISLKAARINANMTQAELGKKIGRNPSTILNWENGKTKIPLDDFKKICKVLNVNENNIFFAD